MAIERKHKQQPTITEAGEYIVQVVEVNTGMSKSGKPMCTVVFETEAGERINGYYVGSLKFHMAALSDCKLGAGLAKNASATALVGRKLGIAVEPGKARDDGSHFMAITGYGTVRDVFESRQRAAQSQDSQMPYSDTPPPSATEFAQNPDNLDNIPF